jgi:ribose-phosphate pyrophosphokinase
MSLERMKIFSGSSNVELAKKICKALDLELGKMDIAKDPDGSTTVKIKEVVRGSTVYVIQSGYPNPDNQIMEFLLIADAMRRASAKVVAVLPLFPYSRFTKKGESRIPIGAKVVMDLLGELGVQRVIAMELHSSEIQGFTSKPVDHLFASSIFIEDIRIRFHDFMEDVVIVDPDGGSMKIVKAYARELKVGLAVTVGPDFVAGDVKGKTAIVLDDMVITCKTIRDSTEALRQNGAKEVHLYVTHNLAADSILDNLNGIDSITTTDTLAPSGGISMSNKIRVLSCSKLLAETLERIHNEDSISKLFVT